MGTFGDTNAEIYCSKIQQSKSHTSQMACRENPQEEYSRLSRKCESPEENYACTLELDPETRQYPVGKTYTVGRMMESYETVYQ